MARKPARMYTCVKGQAYTQRKYMGGVPHLRIIQFELGNITREFPLTVDLLAKETSQIRDIALESARIASNKYLAKKVGDKHYHLKFMVYPHHVLRENKQATGAGADRVSQGMRAAFGKPVGTAARVTRNQVIIRVRTTPENLEHAKIALMKAGSKLPTPCKIVVVESQQQQP